jgi:aminoglycoside phosphotransferase (APT) family kinase protein
MGRAARARRYRVTGEPISTTDTLQCFLDDALGEHVAISVTPMAGGGSCEVFAIDRGLAQWVLRRAPGHASSATAHDVLREFRILDAIKDEPVAIARPVVACKDPEVFGAPFYVMERIDGRPILRAVPDGWAAAPESHGRAIEELIDALVAIHAVDWRSSGLEDMAHPGNYLSRQRTRWLNQLDSYGGRDLPDAHRISDWLEAHRPADQPSALCHGDYKLDNVLFAPDAPPRLLAVVDWEMAAIGDPLVDLAWALVFHPGPEGTIPLGRTKEPRFDVAHLPDRASLVERYATRSGRSTASIGWYDVFARWKLAIVLEGSYAKFLRGRSDKPMHEFFGAQVDLLLDSATTLIDQGEPT